MDRRDAIAALVVAGLCGCIMIAGVYAVVNLEVTGTQTVGIPTQAQIQSCDVNGSGGCVVTDSGQGASLTLPDLTNSSLTNVVTLVLYNPGSIPVSLTIAATSSNETVAGITGPSSLLLNATDSASVNYAITPYNDGDTNIQIAVSG